MEPHIVSACPPLIDRVSEGIERIKSACVDIAGLRAHDDRSVSPDDRIACGIGSHGANVVGLDRRDGVATKADRPDRAADR